MPAKKRYATEIRSIRVALRQLVRSFDRLASVLATAESPREKRPRRKLRLTPARRAALKLQGRYMGYLRGLKPTQIARVKKIRAQKGIRAAIAEAGLFRPGRERQGLGGPAAGGFRLLKEGASAGERFPPEPRGERRGATG